jgi:Ulp1 family protease
MVSHVCHAEIYTRSIFKSDFGELTAKDLEVLEPGRWANDEIVLWAVK